MNRVQQSNLNFIALKGIWFASVTFGG